MSSTVAPELTTSSKNTTTGVLPVGLFGALIILLGYAAGLYVSENLIPTSLPFIEFIRLATLLGITFAVSLIGTRLLGSPPPLGTRGAIFLSICTVFVDFFLIRAVASWFQDSSMVYAITGVVAAVVAFFSYRFLSSKTATQWMVNIEQGHWLSFHGFKATQGLKLRRYTMLAVLIVGWSGVWSLMYHQMLPTGNWELSLPFTEQKLLLMTTAQYTIPILLAVATFWIGWRMVNMPSFADFLIATEAEMNKVSWSSRKRMVQDTIVVLVTVVILTAFLLVVDVFWGWLLSRQIIGVLPPKTQMQQDAQSPTGKPTW